MSSESRRKSLSDSRAKRSCSYNGWVSTAFSNNLPDRSPWSARAIILDEAHSSHGRTGLMSHFGQVSCHRSGHRWLKLIAFRVTNFRSVEDSDWIEGRHPARVLDEGRRGPVGIQHHARVRDGERRASQGELDQWPWAGDRRGYASYAAARSRPRSPIMRPFDRRISFNGTSPPIVRIRFGWRISPTSPHGRALSTWPSLARMRLVEDDGEASVRALAGC